MPRQPHPFDRALDVCAALCRTFKSRCGLAEALRMGGRLHALLHELDDPAVREGLKLIAADRIGRAAAESLRREEAKIEKQMAAIDRRVAAAAGKRKGGSR